MVCSVLFISFGILAVSFSRRRFVRNPMYAFKFYARKSRLSVFYDSFETVRVLVFFDPGTRFGAQLATLIHHRDASQHTMAAITCEMVIAYNRIFIHCIYTIYQWASFHHSTNDKKSVNILKKNS